MSGMVRGLAVLAVAAAGVLVWVGRSSAIDPMDHAIETLLNLGPTGAVVVFEADNGTRDVRAYGSLAGKSAPDTLRFRLASLTKPVVAAAIVSLVDEEELALGDRLPDLLPELPLGDPRAQSITLRDLLRHSAGIDETKLAPLFMAPDQLAKDLGVEAEAQSDCSAIAAAMLARPLAFAPATDYQYSNTGYCLLGLILEDRTGMPLEQAIHLLVGEATSLTLDLASLDVDGEIADNQRDWLVRRARVVGAAGGLVGSATDYLAFLMRPVAEVVADVPPYVSENDQFYGLGWRIWPKSECPARTHFGAMPGAYSLAVVGEDGQRMVALFEGRPLKDWPAFHALVAATCGVFETRR